jgi:hypothetical protein
LEHDDIFEHYTRVVAIHDGIEIKGAKSSYTAINGNMFSFIDDEDRLCLRFSEARKEELNVLHDSSDVIQYGAVMRGYVALLDDVARNKDMLDSLFTESLEFAKSLKLKPTKKKRK